MKLYTVGYQDTNIDQFVSFLKKKHIELIVDVRKNPVSRKKGFSKNKLAEALGTQDIEYMHLPALGMPKEWRDKAKEGVITRTRMFQDFTKKIIPKMTDEISLIRQLAREKNTCLLCFEADADDCHRRNVADAVKKLDKKTQVVDLEVHQLKMGRVNRLV